MKIKYTGTPGENQEFINQYGYVFPKGQFVDVQDAFAARKLSKHPHFEAKGEEVTDVNPKAVEAEKKALALLAEAEAIEQKDAEKEKADTIAALTDEDKYGKPEPTGDEGSAEAGRAGSVGKRGPGRPPKGS